MKLIVDIDENVYKDLKEYFKKEYSNACNNCGLGTELAIANGTPLEEELKTIKAEFEEDKYILLNQTTAIKVIDKHIAELKGENNG